MVQAVVTPHTLREANCELRRQRILEAARELIVSEGTQAVTMRRLAKEAGLSVTTLYNLIGGRDRIVSTDKYRMSFRSKFNKKSINIIQTKCYRYLYEAYISNNPR